MPLCGMRLTSPSRRRVFYGAFDKKMVADIITAFYKEIIAKGQDMTGLLLRASFNASTSPNP
jgi:hypothetical protein